MNKASSVEWITIAYHDLRSAQILFEANHYLVYNRDHDSGLLPGLFAYSEDIYA